MNQNNNHKFSKEDRNLFGSIADHIQANPNDYKQAGKWLDEYCSESAYWSRKKDELKRLKEKRDSFPVLAHQNEVGRLENKIKEKRTPALSIRFNEAQDYFSDKYRDLELIPKEEAKKIILITWLITDPDAENTKLNITKFENWKWEPLDDVSKLSRGFKGFLFAQNKAPWMRLVHIAWDKITISKYKKKRKKLIGVIVGIIISLAALTTLILNLDRIKEKIWGETEKQIPSHKTENTLHKPIVVASATVEVRIKSDWDFDGRVANTKAYLAFVKGNKPLLITSSIGYTASQTGNDEVVYKGKLDMDAKDSAVGNPVSYLRDAEYVQIEFGRMPSDSDVLGGDVICIINNSVRLEFSIPPQRLVNNRIFIRHLSESLQVLNEPEN